MEKWGERGEGGMSLPFVQIWTLSPRSRKVDTIRSHVLKVSPDSSDDKMAPRTSVLHSGTNFINTSSMIKHFKLLFEFMLHLPHVQK